MTHYDKLNDPNLDRLAPGVPRKDNNRFTLFPRLHMDRVDDVQLYG